LSEARPGDGLKAAEMSAKMCGWNEPEKPPEHQHMHIHVDAGLIEELRTDYASLGARERKTAAVEGTASKPPLLEG
jgi:hypothetical protein